MALSTTVRTQIALLNGKSKFYDNNSLYITESWENMIRIVVSGTHGNGGVKEGH